MLEVVPMPMPMPMPGIGMGMGMRMGMGMGMGIAMSLHGRKTPCWGLDTLGCEPGPFACEADVMPLHHVRGPPSAWARLRRGRPLRVNLHGRRVLSFCGDAIHASQGKLRPKMEAEIQRFNGLAWLWFGLVFGFANAANSRQVFRV